MLNANCYNYVQKTQRVAADEKAGKHKNIRKERRVFVSEWKFILVLVYGRECGWLR